SQPPLLLVRLLLQQMQTLQMLTPMLRPRQPTPTTPTQPRVTQPQQPPIPWASLLELSRPVASHPPFKARPTTCVAIPGSARPTAQTAFTIASCLLPERTQNRLTGGNRGNGGLLAFHLCSLRLLLLNLVFHLLAPGRIRR